MTLAKGISANFFMNKLEVKGAWNIAKGKMKQTFAKFTKDSAQFIEGKQQELTGRILKRSGAAQKANF